MMKQQQQWIMTNMMKLLKNNDTDPTKSTSLIENEEEEYQLFFLKGILLGMIMGILVTTTIVAPLLSIIIWKKNNKKLSLTNKKSKEYNDEIEMTSSSSDDDDLISSDITSTDDDDDDDDDDDVDVDDEERHRKQKQQQKDTSINLDRFDSSSSDERRGDDSGGGNCYVVKAGTIVKFKQRCQPSPSPNTATRNVGTGSSFLKVDDDDNNNSSNKTKDDSSSSRVLREALTLVQQMHGGGGVGDGSNNNNNNNNVVVVRYQSPDLLLNTFLKETGTSMDLNLNLNSNPKQANNNNDNDNNNNDADASDTMMIRVLNTVKKYSVNTSHKYFFNQMFGTLDEVALASEMLALSLNTSPYTYEAAPVFTLMERSLIQALGKLIYHYDGNENDEDKQESDEYDGLMMPGGSLSNLNAIHIARHTYCQKWLEATKTKQQRENDVSTTTTTTTPPAMTTTVRQVRDLLIHKLVGFVSSEAHYSFKKAFNVLGLSEENLMIVKTDYNGVMDTCDLYDKLITSHQQGLHPFFVGATSGSTVRGSFDSLEDIANTIQQYYKYVKQQQGSIPSVWFHVDGAWGGSSLFSRRSDIQQLMKGVSRCDSLTVNPHKMLGAPLQTTCFITRHKGCMYHANSSKAKYLFDPRKFGSEFDCGDATFTCGRRTDVFKFWSLIKYYGREGLATRVEQKVDTLKEFVEEIQRRPNFLLACKPWPFNVNFYYIPPRLLTKLVAKDNGSTITSIPSNLSHDVSNVTVQLKLKLHEAGEMLIPYQPIGGSNQPDCFRLLLSGKKEFSRNDIYHVLDTMERYGVEL